MALPKLNPEIRDWLIRTMVEIAHIDGRVVPVEGVLSDNKNPALTTTRIPHPVSCRRL